MEQELKCYVTTLADTLAGLVDQAHRKILQDYETKKPVRV